MITPAAVLPTRRNLSTKALLLHTRRHLGFGFMDLSVPRSSLSP